MSITWIFTIICLFFCCVALYNLRKMQKGYKALREIKVDGLKDIAETAAKGVINNAVCSALRSINSPKTEGYLVTSFSDTPQRYAVWRKCEMEENFFLYTKSYGMGYILVKMFDSPNAEENLRNATKLCRMLNDGIEKGEKDEND